jgi:DUF4097 and DUF4098 domain-containing protein YvlB
MEQSLLILWRNKMKPTVKLSLLLIFLVNSVSLMNCNQYDPICSNNPNDNVSNTNFTAEDSFSYEIDVMDHSGLSLEAINGTIVVSEDSEANSVKIRGVRQVQSESIRDANAHLEELMVDIRDLKNEILVRTIQPNQSEGRNYIINYTITLPRNMDININGVNGHIILDEIQGNVFVNLINGNIDGEVSLPPGGTINMNLINGNMVLNIPENTSAQIGAKTINGSVSAANLEIQNRIETSNSLTGTCGDGDGEIFLNTINGNIMVIGF